MAYLGNRQPVTDFEVPGILWRLGGMIESAETDRGMRTAGARLASLRIGSTTYLLIAIMVRMTPLEEGFLARLQGYLDLGFSFMRANRALQFTLGSEVRSRTRKRLVKANLSSSLNDRQDLDSTTRNVLDLFHPAKV